MSAGGYGAQPRLRVNKTHPASGANGLLPILEEMRLSEEEDPSQHGAYAFYALSAIVAHHVRLWGLAAGTC
jgi:hypothetical protein